jgi:hypothetical protein
VSDPSIWEYRIPCAIRSFPTRSKDLVQQENIILKLSVITCFTPGGSRLRDFNVPFRVSAVLLDVGNKRRQL